MIQVEKGNSFQFCNSKNLANFLTEALELDCFKISRSSCDLEILSNPRFLNWLKNEFFVIFGTGGSSLGAQAIYGIAKTRLPTQKKFFFIDSLDPDVIADLFANINLEKTGFLCISKSGETLETLTQVRLTLQMCRDLKNLADKFIVITEEKKSTLYAIALENNFLIARHEKSIGGRFSVLSNVGMIPAKIFGLDPFEIRKGAQSVFDIKNVVHSTDGVFSDEKAISDNALDNINEFNLCENFYNSINFIINNLKKNVTNHVFFVYSNKMKKFSEWLNQLYAESTGKDEKGITPILATGSIDQHSQLQLYLDGPKDKFFTFFTHDYQNTGNCEVGGHSLAQFFRAQYDATLMSLKEKKMNVRGIALHDFSPYNIGMLFSYFMLEVITICKCINVDAFNQPAVERGKIITMDLLKNDF